MRTKNPFLRLNRTPITMKKIVLHCNLICRHLKSTFWAIISLNLFLYSFLDGQNQSDDSEVYDLSPFEVSSEGDVGYRAANSLAGTRINTSLHKIPAAISVLTKEFLDDINAENTEEFVRFATSSRMDTSDAAGVLAQAFDVRVTIRGFRESSITRDYLPNMVWGRGVMATDRFNVDRVDLSRGPNSILYGIGGPGGAINTTSKRAVINGQFNSVSVTFGRWNKYRGEVDLNFPLLEDKLAVRVNSVHEDRDGWRDFEHFKQEGLALAGTYQPFEKTQIRAGYERVIRDQLTPGNFPESDGGGSTWILEGSPLAGDPLLPGTNPAPGVIRSRQLQQVFYAPQLRAQPFRMSTIGADVRPDLEGNQPSGFWDTVPGAGAPAGGRVTDPHIGDVIPENAFLAGPGRTSDNDYSIFSLFLDQRIGDLFIEAGYRRSSYYRDFRHAPGLTGAIGDPNPVIPGAYLADGDSRIAGGRNPGTLLSDIGLDNPQVGELYVEGQASHQVFDEENDNYRLSVAYELDFTERSLGRHSFAGVWQKDESLRGGFGELEYNLTPNNDRPIDAPVNRIWRRTYLDFESPGGVRGAFDPWANPIAPRPGLTPAFVALGQAAWRTFDNETWMIALHSEFFDERIAITAGYREDTLKNNVATKGAKRIPNSNNLWDSQHTGFESVNERKFEGDTSTLGAVYSPLDWLALSYNTSDSILPQEQEDIWGDPVGTRTGEGEDFGVRLNLLNGSLYLNVNHYVNNDINQWTSVFNARHRQMVRALNQVLETMNEVGDTLPQSLEVRGITELEDLNRRPVTDSDGSGTEFEVVGNLGSGWRVSVNYSRNEIEYSNLIPDMRSFLEETQGIWDNNNAEINQPPTGQLASFIRDRDATPGRDFDAEPATFNDAYDFAQSVMDQVDLSQGQAVHAHIFDSGNAFLSYRFQDDVPGFLKEGRLGFGANYIDGPVIGYDEARNGEMIFGESEIYFNIMLGKSFKLPFKDHSLDVQLNVDNVFANEDLEPWNATEPGNVVRYIFPRQRREWTLRATYRF